MQGLNTLKLQLHAIAQQHSLLSRAFRGSAFSFVLVFSLVFAQAVNLNHSHEGDLREQVDCEICLKVSSSDDVLIGGDLVANVATPASHTFDYSIAASSVAVPTPSARAPPHA